jgi:hypothetical protein
VKKRRRAVVHYFNVRAETDTSWMNHKPAVPGWAAALYCATWLGPLYHTLRGLVRDRDWRWCWHPPTCFGSLLGTLWGWLTQKLRGKGRDIHDLRVDQTLRANSKSQVPNPK